MTRRHPLFVQRGALGILKCAVKGPRFDVSRRMRVCLCLCVCVCVCMRLPKKTSDSFGVPVPVGYVASQLTSNGLNLVTLKTTKRGEACLNKRTREFFDFPLKPALKILKKEGNTHTHFLSGLVKKSHHILIFTTKMV